METISPQKVSRVTATSPFKIHTLAGAFSMRAVLSSLSKYGKVKMMVRETTRYIKQAIQELQRNGELPQFSIPEILVERPREASHGDYATNIALRIAKLIEKEPMEIARAICAKLKGPFEKIESAKPGFINFFLAKHVLLEQLKRILKEKKKFGTNSIGKGKTIIIEYSSPNIAKPFSIGHLRSTIIGQTLYNCYAALGYKVVGINHLGDWGTQFGKLIYAIKAWGSEREIAKDPVPKLVALYVRFHKIAEQKPELEEEGRKWFKKLEQGDREAERIWKQCVKWSMLEFERIYKVLGVAIDYVHGESFYRKMLDGVILEAKKKGIAQKSKGALIISYPNDVLPPMMIQKSDGATLYATRDLAAIKYRRKKFKPQKIIYEVGSDQTLHFKQLFWAAELFGWGVRAEYVHVAHGLTRLQTGKMRTREGHIILLEDVLHEAIERAKKVVDEKNPKMKVKEKEQIARVVGIGAVKYNDLSRHPSTDIVFDWKKILNLQGNSGPYLQYTYARAKSILRKAKVRKGDIAQAKEREEWDLLKVLYQFPEAVEQVAAHHSPNLLCNYLFGLAQRFNTFYETLPVLKEKDKQARNLRLALVASTAQILKNGLNLLGIEVLEKM